MQLQTALWQAVPDCDEVRRYGGGFTPHLSVGQAREQEAMVRLKRVFAPWGRFNPGKVFPTPRLCGEVPGPYRAHPAERAGLAERF